MGRTETYNMQYTKSGVEAPTAGDNATVPFQEITAPLPSGGYYPTPQLVGVCPSCGRCPHCGQYGRPYNPYQGPIWMCNSNTYSSC